MRTETEGLFYHYDPDTNTAKPMFDGDVPDGAYDGWLCLHDDTRVYAKAKVQVVALDGEVMFTPDEGDEV